MKKILLLALWLMCNTFNAQSQDLAKLATGVALGFSAIFDDNDDLYGYLSIYGYDKTGDKTKKFEYVILDKNLNPVANNTFEGEITASNYIGHIGKENRLTLYPINGDAGLKKNDFFTPTTRQIDLATNKVKRNSIIEYVNGEFIEVEEKENLQTFKEYKKEVGDLSKNSGYKKNSNVIALKEGYLVLHYEYDDFPSHIKSQSIEKYYSNKKSLWTYQYNENIDSKKAENLIIFDYDENYIYAYSNLDKKDFSSCLFKVIDMKSGKIVMSKPIEISSLQMMSSSIYAPYHKKKVKHFDENIVFIAEENRLGFAQVTIDTKTPNIDVKKILFTDLEKYFKNINKYGYVDKEYFLKLKDKSYLKDGSAVLLMEKQKYNSSMVPITSDLVFILTDKDFKVKDVKIFEKEKTKGAPNSDYLFSQSLNYGKDVVFFYRDYQKDEKTKEKNWNLFINTLIDGQFKQEMIPISAKDDFFVTPYVGKEGYILLREYNEKEKFNKIRLERLNY